jgi:hypothetical protein
MELPPGFDDDKSWVAIFVVVMCLTVATTMVGLRIWTRKFIINKMGMDDWAAIVTLVWKCSQNPHAHSSVKYSADDGEYSFSRGLMELSSLSVCSLNNTMRR